MRNDRNGTPWWMRLFAAIGLYATVIHLLQLFVTFGRSTKPPRAETLPQPGSADFMNALAASMNTDVRRGGEVRLLDNGDAFFPALLEAIRGARHHIHLMTYIWRPGRISDEIFEALLERARAGVEVRLMIDGIGSFIAPQKHLHALRKAGGQTAVFSPLFSTNFVHLNQRNHRRAFVFDGRLAFTGGMSVADHWTGDAEGPHQWRDTMVRVTGPMARTVQVAFIHLWTNVTGEHLIGGEYVPPLSDEEAGSDIRHLGVAHSPDPAEQPLMHLFWLSVQAARERVYIANAYFAPSRYFRDVLRARARDGVDVRLLLPGRHTDNPFVRWAAQSWYDELLEDGVRVYEFTPTMMHAKYMAVDGCWTVIGSANIDIRSIKLNQENVLGIADGTLARDVEAQFRRDLARAREVKLDEWEGRAPWYRLREGVSFLFRAQY